MNPWNLLLGTFSGLASLNDDLLIFRRATRIEIESDPSMAFNVDGLGEASGVFEVQPRALEMVMGVKNALTSHP